MAALLRSGKFLRMVSGAARQQTIGQPPGNNGNSGVDLSLASADAATSSSSLGLPSFESQSSSSSSSGQFGAGSQWSVQGLQAALPALSIVHQPDQDKKDPLLFFDHHPVLPAITEDITTEAATEAVEAVINAVDHDDAKPALTSSTDQGLNLFKTDPKLRWSAADESSNKVSGDAKPAAAIVSSSSVTTDESPERRSSSPASSVDSIESVPSKETTTAAESITVPSTHHTTSIAAPAAPQPPALAELVGDSSSNSVNVVPVVPLADATSQLTQWYPLPVVCQMFRQQGRYWDLEMLLEGSRGIRPEDRKMVYFWTLQSYADVGLFDRAVALSGQLHLEGLGAHFPEYHALMSSFAAAHTSFAPTMPYSAYADGGGVASAVVTDVSQVTSPRSSCPPTPAPCTAIAEANKANKAEPAASKTRRRPSATPSADRTDPKARRIHMKTQLLARRFKKALADEDVEEAAKSLADLKDVNGGSNGGGVKALSVTELSAYIELLVKEEKVGEATGLAQEMLAQDLYPMPKIFRFLLNKLASGGHVDAMTRLGDCLTSKVKKEVSFDNRLCNAYLASGRGGEYLDLLTTELDEVIASGKDLTTTLDDEDGDEINERVQSLKDKFPRGGAMGLLESNPDLVDSFTSLAHKFLILGYVAPMNVLWTYHFIGGRHHLAEPLWDKYVKDCPQIMFQKVCQTARATSDPDLAQRLVDLLQNAVTVTVGARGIAYSCLLDVLAARKEYVRGVAAVREALEAGLTIDDINRTALKRLKEGLEETTDQQFPYQIPKKTAAATAAKGVVLPSAAASTVVVTSDDVEAESLHSETSSVVVKV